MMVVGLKSGREFVVEDGAYNLQSPDGKITHIFLTPKKEQLITIEHANVEFFIESATQERMDTIKAMAMRKPETKKVGAEYA